MQSFRKTFKVGGSYIYGRADDVNRIIDLLSSEDGTNVCSTFVSIVADRGTGRTTLLHLLHNALCRDFDKRKLICMPEKFDEKRLMRVIIESLTGTPCDIADLKILEETVKEELMDQSLLLLLDNFENKSQKCWDLLSAFLKVCKVKSAVVVTTTRKAIAEVKGPMRFYYMNSLSDEWCSLIFKQCVFTGQNPDAGTELADIGKYLVAKCRNNTLCIKVLSGLLRHSITVDWWKVVLDNNFWEMDEVEGDVLPALRVCYEYFPCHLKRCFNYCSLFPKEYIFSKKYLVRMWLSQGFIEPCEGRDIEDIGLEYFDQLLSQSFFQCSLIPDMKEDKFGMPGLIHDLAQQLSKNECFQFEGCVQRAPESICHLSLVAHEFRSVSLNHFITRAQNLQTFLVLSTSAFQHHISSCILNLVDVDDLFVKFCNLVTLNLNNTDIKQLPETFGSLNNLRYLNLSGTNIKRIPLEISNLIHLETLEAKECHYLEELPRTMEALTNLRYLDVTKEVGSVVMPHGIGKLTNLRSLVTFNVGMDPLLHCGIEELKDMMHLKGCLEISGLIHVRSGIDAKESHMRSKEHIETLFLHWSDEKIFLEGDEGTEIAEEVLEGLYPTYNLKEIIIRGYPGNYFPTWVESDHFSRLVSVIFDNCYNCEILPDLGRLPSLKFLSVGKMYSVLKMNLSDSEFNPENSVRYPSLEQLTIWEMYELVEWVEIGNQDFPALQSLCINSCPLLRNVPKFPALVELSVYSCAQFLEAVNLQTLQSLRIEGLLKIKSVKLSKDLVGLKKLEISHCPEALSIEGLSCLNSLETVIIFRCPQLDSHDILDGRHFTFEERGNTSVWLCQEKISLSDMLEFMCDEGQDHPIVLNKRKDRDDLSSLSGVLADGHKKMKELESQMSKEDHELVETTVQSSIASRSAILDSSSDLIQHSEPSSPVGSLIEPASGSGTTQDAYTEVSNPLRVIRERKKNLPRWRAQVCVTASSPLDDGYTWRKYGQKNILGCKFPRSYFRCTHKITQGCMATKQIQKTDEDPFVYDIIYQGIHICRNTATVSSVTPSRELLPATESLSTYFSFMSPMRHTSGPGNIVREEESGIVNQPSSSAFEEIAWQQNLSEAMSDPKWEKLSAFSPTSSSFDARSETEASDYKDKGMQLALEDLETIKVIGKGSSGIVQLLRHKWNGKFYALKGIQMNVQETICKQIVQELEINQVSQCPQIVTCYHSFCHNGVISLVLEYMDRGSLADIIKQVKTILEPYLAVLCKQVLKGLVHLHHKRHVIHRDIKPSNLLVNHKGEVKITNFGMSALLASSTDQRDTFAGGHNYMSPERINGSPYDYKSDIWSLGLIVLECAIGRFPYIPSDESKGWISFYELLEAIADQPPPSVPPDQFSPEFCSFISACTQKDPKERMSSLQLLDHPLIKKFEDKDIDLGILVSSLDPP